MCEWRGGLLSDRFQLLIGSRDRKWGRGAQTGKELFSLHRFPRINILLCLSKVLSSSSLLLPSCLVLLIYLLLSIYTQPTTCIIPLEKHFRCRQLTPLALEVKDYCWPQWEQKQSHESVLYSGTSSPISVSFDIPVWFNRYWNGTEGSLKPDKRKKKKVQITTFTFYCVTGY